jgi:anti-sigma B factor antagonist
MTKHDAPTPDGSRGFEITTERDPHGVRVRVVGELDIATAPALDLELAAVAIDRDERVLIDLDGVRFIDSSGISAVVRAKYAADRDGYRLTVRYSSPQVRRLLELTSMLEYLTFE